MELFERKKVDFQHTDVRGSLTQLVHEGFAQINVLESNKGATRGAHFHRVSREAFYVITGSVEVMFKSKEKVENVTFHAGEFFEVLPFVLHNMFFPEYCLMVQMYSIPVEKEDGTKDIHTEDDF